MAYQIVKGWPSEGAIDPIITLTTDGSVAPGYSGVIDSPSGQGIVGIYPLTLGATSIYTPFFCIDVDEVTHNVTGLMSKCIIEMDATHYVAGSYVAGAKLSLTASVIAEHKGGKFSMIAASGDARPAVAQVISYNAITGKLRVLWL